MSALPPDYDTDPERWRSWVSPRDVHEVIAPELRGPVLDVGCGEGRLVSLLDDDVVWIGVDASPAQVNASTSRSVVLADMCALPFRGGAVDAEDALAIAEVVFEKIKPERWDRKFFPLERAEEVAVPLWLTKRGVLLRATKV